MGMTAVEKALARASGAESVAPGDVVYPEADLVFVHDGHVEGCRKELDALGIDRITRPERVVFATDHEVVYLTPRAAERGALIRETAARWGVGRFYDVGQGGHGHIFPMETGLVVPGTCLFASDMHCSNFGAVGAIALRAGPVEVVSVLAMGTLWTTVPPTVRVRLGGALAPGVCGRDIGYKLAWSLVQGPSPVDVDYRFLELTGTALASFDINDLVALCNSPTEVGVAGVFIPPSAKTLAWCEARVDRPFTPVYSDDDAVFEQDIALDIGALQPQVATPGSPANAVDVDSIGEVPVQHAYLGSCGSGMYEDFVRAAQVLRGRKIARGTRLFVVPGTTGCAERLMADGYTRIFADAGAVILPPGCGPCAGGNLGPMHAGETSISTAATNHAGRMGARDARCYLGSPVTVAASAVRGRITDPRVMLGEAS